MSLRDLEDRLQTYGVACESRHKWLSRWFLALILAAVIPVVVFVVSQRTVLIPLFPYYLAIMLALLRAAIAERPVTDMV